ncbi:nucleoside 2-deoxyribosyltransferase [Mangrovitalea sediminis]|uniref:nucleoside 2-deoxyribosyltransferase n=1 Tax=Mangrovitalea sediminis TaxID=1982043 RepID=UPI000BE602B7|nr:nucleoside 2-deoxyribosyltransferase [Mangrovitalea sediminis]
MPVYPRVSQPVHSLYLAGPEVFLPDAVAVGAAKCELLAGYGLRGLFPLDNAEILPASPMARGKAIYAANRELMMQADGALVNLTPFRGPSADPGTVFELGFFLARGIPVIAYTLDCRDYAERAAAGAVVDAQGLAVEHFGMADNLMLEAGLDAAGGRLLRGTLSRPAGPDDWRDLALFDAAAQAWLADFSGLAVHRDGESPSSGNGP